MNKRYIDFVPVKRKPMKNREVYGVGESRSASRRKTTPQVVEKAWIQEDEYYADDASVDEMFVERALPVGVSTGLTHTKKNMVEDYQPKFVKTEVKKRPLSGGKPSGRQKVMDVSKTAVKSTKMPAKAAKTDVMPAKTPLKPAKTVSGANLGLNRTATASKKSIPQGVAKLQPTRAKFLNTNKIVKRPLSGSSYAGRLQTTSAATSGKVAESTNASEKSEKPTMIIAKPEKDSKAGLVVSIIITIILGAAAGTVAFLLLPK